jgi:hypothetical protein
MACSYFSAGRGLIKLNQLPTNKKIALTKVAKPRCNGPMLRKVHPKRDAKICPIQNPAQLSRMYMSNRENLPPFHKWKTAPYIVEKRIP